MANQVIVTDSGNVQVAVSPPANVQVQISRSVIGTVANVDSANYANFAGTVTGANQSNITTVGTLSNLSVANTITTLNLNVTGNFSVGNLIANSANYANFANVSNIANSVAGSNVSGAVANATYANSANTANLATYATTANAVAGANVSGQVNYAAVANSVAVANVSGIGNIAITNYDGNGSNILHGNGYWGPEIGPQSVANANYANFAGTAYSVSGSNVSGAVNLANYATVSNSVAGSNVSGAVGLATYATTANSVAGANVSGQVSYAAVANSVSGANVSGDVSGANHANVADVANSVSGSNVSGAVNLANYATTANAVAGANVSGAVSYATTANSVALANVSGAGNIASLNLDGNASNILFGNGIFSAIPVVSNVANANYSNFAGTAYSVSGSNVSGDVSGANHANVADVANSVSGSNVSGAVGLATYATTANSVAGANVSGEVAYAATANSVALANVSGAGNIASLNLDGSSSNVLYGNGVFAPESQTGNANYAAYAGNVTVNAQSNITSLGNLVSLTINNGNVTLPTKQFNPTGVDVGSNANILLMSNSSFVDVDYGNGQGGGNLRYGKTTTYVKARGNSSAIASAAASDVAGRTNYMFYNGTSNVLAVATQVNLTTLNSNANAITSGGNFQIITANPSGDQGNANALSNQNYYAFENSGRLTIQTGAATGGGSYMVLGGYGITAGGNGSQSQGISFTRYRGNRDSNLSVQANDQLGAFGFLGYNGTSLYTARSASIQGVVDSAYVTNATVITSGFKLTSVNTSNQNDFWFYSNGNARLGLVGGGNTTFQTDATVFVNNLDATSNANVAGNLNVTGTISYNTRTFGSFTSNVTQTSAGANTTNYMTFNNDEGSNGVSIVSNSQITVARTGRYNIQFSAQLSHDTNQTANVEIWLTKNGSAVANTNGRLTLVKDQPTIAAWNFLDNVTSANSYYQIAWASPDTNMELVAYDTANTISGVAIPSIIATVVPVGA